MLAWPVADQDEAGRSDERGGEIPRHRSFTLIRLTPRLKKQTMTTTSAIVRESR
jgi:hypothetical protein